MIKKHFSYHAPSSVTEAAELLAVGNGKTEVIGGGTWVVPEMTSGTRLPTRVVDLANTGLKRIEAGGDAVVIGAMVTYRDLIDSAVIASELPMLRTLAVGITGGSQIWNRGTIGGSACYANPNSDAPAALVALDATLRLRSVHGPREVSAADFFLDAFAVDVLPGELLEEIVINRGLGELCSGYYKFKLCEGSWPIVTGAYAKDGGGERVVLGGVQATPVRVELRDAGGVEIVAAVDAAVTRPRDDALASGGYKKSIAGVIARRAADQANGG